MLQGTVRASVDARLLANCWSESRAEPVIPIRVRSRVVHIHIERPARTAIIPIASTKAETLAELNASLLPDFKKPANYSSDLGNLVGDCLPALFRHRADGDAKLDH